MTHEARYSLGQQVRLRSTSYVGKVCELWWDPNERCISYWVMWDTIHMSDWYKEADLTLASEEDIVDVAVIGEVTQGTIHEGIDGSYFDRRHLPYVVSLSYERASELLAALAPSRSVDGIRAFWEVLSGLYSLQVDEGEDEKDL